MRTFLREALVLFDIALVIVVTVCFVVLMVGAFILAYHGRFAHACFDLLLAIMCGEWLDRQERRDYRGRTDA